VRFEEGPLRELAESIQQHGLLQPIVVRPVREHRPGGALYEIVAGERRYRACKMAGLEEISVRIHHGLDDEQALKLAIIENVQRVDLDPIEEAAGYRRLAGLGMKQLEIAAAVQKSQPAVANRMRLLELPEDVQERIRQGELTPAHGVALASWKQLPKVASKLAEFAAANNWTSKQMENPLGQGWQVLEVLKQTNVMREGYSALFDRQICHRCPYDAYRNPGNGYGFCFRPEHYDELNEAAKATRETERRAKILTAVETAEEEGVKLPSLHDLPYDSYERLNDTSTIPSGCTDTCPNRGKALGYSGEVVPVCLDPKCYRKLKSADTRAENRAGRELAVRLLRRLEQKIDGTQAFGTREMAVITVLAFRNDWRSGHGMKEACERQGVPEIARLIKDNWGVGGKPWSGAQRYDALASYSLVQMAKVVLETVIRSELHYRYQERATSESPITDWWLGKGEA